MDARSEANQAVAFAGPETEIELANTPPPSGDSNQTPASQKNLWKKIWPITVIIMVDFTSLNMIIPLLPFFGKKFQASPLTISLLFSIFSLCQLFATPVLGYLSDKYGRRKILILSQAGMAASFVLMAAANSMAWLFASRILAGITGANLSVALAYMADVTTPKERAFAFGKVILANGVAYFLGAYGAGLLFEIHPSIPALAAALLSVVSIVTTATMVERHVRPRDPTPRPKRKLLARRHFPIVGSLFLYYIIFGFFVYGIGTYCTERFADRMGVHDVGFVYSFMGIFMIVNALTSVPLSLKYLGEEMTVSVGFIIGWIGFGAMALIDSPYYLLIAIPVAQICTAIVRPALQSYLSRSVDKSQQGVIMGFNDSLVAIGNFMGPLIGGLAIQLRYVKFWAWLPAVLCCCGFLLWEFFPKPELKQ